MPRGSPNLSPWTTAHLPQSFAEAQSPLADLKRSYFSLNFLSDFIEKNSGLGAFRRPSPCLPLGQKHLFTRCPVSTRWGPGLRTGKEATGGPASALEPRRESESDTHTLARAHSPTLPPSLAPLGAALAPSPPACAPRPWVRREPLPQGRVGWGRGGGEAKVTPRSWLGPGSRSSPPGGGGFGVSSRGHQEGRETGGAQWSLRVWG